MNPDPIDTVLFDLDDTLVAFDAVTESSWKQVCDEYCLCNNAISAERLQQVISTHSNIFWSDEERHRVGRLDIVSARREFIGRAFEELSLPAHGVNHLAERYSKVRIDNMYLLPEAADTLSRLKNLGLKLGMVTNGDSPTQRGKIARFNLAGYFSAIMVEGEVGIGKPDERIFRAALEALSSRPERTIMVGDNLKWDIAGPQLIGIRGVWYDWKGTGLPEGSAIVPFKIIRTLSQVLDILKTDQQ